MPPRGRRTSRSQYSPYSRGQYSRYRQSRRQWTPVIRRPQTPSIEIRRAQTRGVIKGVSTPTPPLPNRLGAAFTNALAGYGQGVIPTYGTPTGQAPYGPSAFYTPPRLPIFGQQQAVDPYAGIENLGIENDLVLARELLQARIAAETINLRLNPPQPYLPPLPQGYGETGWRLPTGTTQPSRHSLARVNWRIGI